MSTPLSGGRILLVALVIVVSLARRATWARGGRPADGTTVWKRLSPGVPATFPRHSRCLVAVADVRTRRLEPVEPYSPDGEKTDARLDPLPSPSPGLTVEPDDPPERRAR